MDAGADETTRRVLDRMESRVKADLRSAAMDKDRNPKRQRAELNNEARISVYGDFLLKHLQSQAE